MSGSTTGPDEEPGCTEKEGNKDKEPWRLRRAGLIQKPRNFFNKGKSGEQPVQPGDFAQNFFPGYVRIRTVAARG